jgi:hypothetical protein
MQQDVKVLLISPASSSVMIFMQGTAKADGRYLQLVPRVDQEHIGL